MRGPEHGHFKDRVGLKYGPLTVEALHGFKEHSKRRKYIWLCRCECGAAKLVFTKDLTRRLTSKQCTHAQQKLFGGQKGHALYDTWRNMWKRCTARSYRKFADYGGRGIRVCERWRDFQCFIADVPSRPSPRALFDRIDNDGNYEPGNCRWLDVKASNRNKRPRRWAKRPVDGLAASLAASAAERSAGEN